MGKIAILVYGIVCYASFLVTILYAIGFVGNFVVPKSIDSGTAGAALPAIAINVFLLLLFAIQHTIMARPRFKKWWTQRIPKSIERSTFVLFASLLLLLLFWQWRPMPSAIWSFDSGPVHWILTAICFTGWALVFYSSFLIDHFDLFGLRQVYLHWTDKPYTQKRFSTPTLYRFVRNPLMLGFLIAFWSAPVMTQGRLLFAAVSTAYIFFGVRLEERDLANALGDPYRHYHRKTSMIIPMPPREATSDKKAESVG